MTGDGARKVFTLLVEMRCNSYCVFCGQRQVDAGLVQARRSLGLSTPPTSFGDLRGRYTLGTATEALRVARTEGFAELSLQGGEPTLFPEIVALVSAARELGFAPIGLVTNGRRLADRAFAEALLGAGLDAITFSVLGHDAATHDAAAIAPGSFDELLSGPSRTRARSPATSAAGSPSTSTSSRRRRPSRTSPLRCASSKAAGVDAASLHLVRFDGLAADPAVVASLRFDARALTSALAEAWREGLIAGTCPSTRPTSRFACTPSCGRLSSR